jgi:hypothetical protein
MNRRSVLASLGAVAALALGLTPTVAQAAPSTGYLTILAAHTAESATDNECHVLPGIVTLEQQAAEYKTLGITGITGTVITNWPQTATDHCIAHLALDPQPKPILIASWNRMRALVANDGWSFVSASQNYADVTQETPAQQQKQICGSAQVLKAQNLPGYNGLFAYPNNFYTDAIQTNITDTCYSFGRKYGPPYNALPIPAPHYALTLSLNGGACNTTSLPCYSLPTKFRYNSPTFLASKLKPTAGQWSLVQGYRFATGSGSHDSLSWDCTSTDWQKHWTNGADATELYCWNDWVQAMKQIPAGTTTVTPAQMAGHRG